MDQYTVIIENNPNEGPDFLLNVLATVYDNGEIKLELLPWQEKFREIILHQIEQHENGTWKDFYKF